MADEATTTTETPAANTTEARTPDGTIKDQTTVASATDTTTTNKPADGTSLLNQDDPKKPEDKPADGDKKPDKTGAPEKYEFKAPEGYTYTPESIAEVEPLFRELGLTQDQGQKLMDAYAKKALAAGEASQAAYKTMREGWQKQVVTNPELGDGVKVKAEVKTTIGKALDSLGDPALSKSFKEAMDLTGAGDHPAFVSAFYKLAQAVVEGGHVAGNGPSGHGQVAPGTSTRPSLAQAMYPKANAS